MPHNNAHHHDWTDERIERLKQLWGEGYSASECAKLLGLGITRNSVIGKVHRLGLSGSDRKRRVTTMPNPRKAHETNETVVRQAAKTPPVPPVISPKTVSFSLTLLELKSGMCRWPQGERAPYRFCGAEQVFGSSYCEEHRRMSASGSKLQPVHFNVKSWGTAA